MRKLKLLSLLLFLGSFILIQSCDKEPNPGENCDPIECNTGTQDPETCECDCPDGFTGVNCETEDKCISQNVDCLNGGTCDDGNCDCPDGFTGEFCENIDPSKVQELLDDGTSPKTLYDGGIALTDLYGKTFEGGYIFYLNTADGTGLIAAMEDEVFSYEFGCFGVATTGTGLAIGDGQANTMASTAACNDASFAALQSQDADIDGYTDWYIGSRDEMVELFNNLADTDEDGANTGVMDPGNIGGFVNGNYWSSSETDANTAVVLDFEDGSFSSVGKGFTNRVRSIRSF